MYICHALINTLSAHMIHINLNMIFYTHVKHSSTKTIYIKYYLNKKTTTKNTLQTRTHTHTCARVRTLTHTHTLTVAETGYWYYLGWKYCEKRKVFSLALKDDRVEQCLRSCGSEFQMWGPKQEMVRKPWVLRSYCWISSMRVSEEERSVWDVRKEASLKRASRIGSD